MKLFYSSLLCFLCLNSCIKRVIVEETVDLNSGPQVVSAVNRIPAAVFGLYDQSCTSDKALKDLGPVTISVASGGKEEKALFDFSGVSGFGLKSQYSLGAALGYVWEETYKNCSTADEQVFSCQSSSVEKNPGQLVSICKIPKEGFPSRSIENAALVTMAAYIKSFRNYEITLGTVKQTPSRQIGLLILPTFRRIFQMVDGSTRVRYDVDNARWTNRQEAEYGWKYTIEFLPHSAQSMQDGEGKEYWLQVGVASHETGHHIFASRVGQLKNARSQNLIQSGAQQDILTSYLAGYGSREIGIELPIGALDEGFADMTAHYVFGSGLNPYFQFFTHDDQSRRVSVGQIYGSNDQIKSLSADLIQNFFKQKWSFPPDNYTPNHQDIHAVGAVLANVADEMFGEKYGATKTSPRTDEKSMLANVWVTEVAKAFSQRADFFTKIPVGGYGKDPSRYTSGPAIFLEEIVWIMVANAAIGGGEAAKILSQKQCDIVSTKLPVYAQKWRQQRRYECKPS